MAFEGSPLVVRAASRTFDDGRRTWQKSLSEVSVPSRIDATLLSQLKSGLTDKQGTSCRLEREDMNLLFRRQSLFSLS